ncbi:hypothetical protein RUM43_005928 [Polyplax serrata]|uniref:RRM domain-containing protein n=1 Tax=Polyplax serrata TaxID=468196 RepID=A0AAN8S8U5_POLSC
MVHPGAVREVQAIRTAVRPAAQVPVLDLVLLHLVRVRRVLVRLQKHAQKGSEYHFLYTNFITLSKVIVVDLSTTRPIEPSRSSPEKKKIEKPKEKEKDERDKDVKDKDKDKDRRKPEKDKERERDKDKDRDKDKAKGRGKSRSPSLRRKRKDRDVTPRPTRIHIGHLTRNVTKDHIVEIFSVYGTIRSVDFQMDRFHQHNRGFVYIDFETADEAENAMKHMDGGQIDGQEITAAPVLLPKPRPLPMRRSPPMMRGPPPLRGWRRTPPRYKTVQEI